MSAYYALRLYQRTMHNRRPEGIESREISWRDGVVLVPLVLCILGLALYPQLILKRTDRSASQAVAATQGPSGGPAKTLSRSRPSRPHAMTPPQREPAFWQAPPTAHPRPKAVEQ